VKVVNGFEIPETRDEALNALLDLDLKARVFNPNPRSEFSTIGGAISAYKRRGYVPVWIDATTGKPATLTAEPGSSRYLVKGNGLALVRFAGDPPEYTIFEQEWSLAPRFADSKGVTTWVFRSCGELTTPDVLGFSIESYSSEPAGWAGRFAKYVEMPMPMPSQNDMVWQREPSHVRSLRGIPSVLRQKINRLQAEAL
jgi:hypothetical protein